MVEWQHACCFVHVALYAGNRLGSTARVVQYVSACFSSCVFHTCRWIVGAVFALVLLLGRVGARRTVAWLRGVLLCVECLFCSVRSEWVVHGRGDGTHNIWHCMGSACPCVPRCAVGGGWARIKWLNGNMHAVLCTLHCVLATGLARRRALCSP